MVDDDVCLEGLRVDCRRSDVGNSRDAKYKYAVCFDGNKSIPLHRLIMGVVGRKNIEVDHIDGNTLNNQRNNLRLCSRLENSFNRGVYKNNKSGHRGVSFNKRLNKWEVSIKCNGRSKYGGIFTDISSAINRYNQLATSLFGEFYNPERSKKTVGG